MRRAPCAGSTRLSSLASTSTREPGWMSVQCACQVCVVSARVWRGCREGGHARATSIASSVPVAAGGGAGRMHHAPRATRQLRFDATEWESPTIAQIAVYYSAVAEYAESAENNVRGRRALQSCFYLSWALKYPVSRVLLRTYLKVAHNTE